LSRQKKQMARANPKAKKGRKADPVKARVKKTQHGRLQAMPRYRTRTIKKRAFGAGQNGRRLGSRRWQNRGADGSPAASAQRARS